MSILDFNKWLHRTGEEEPDTGDINQDNEETVERE